MLRQSEGQKRLHFNYTRLRKNNRKLSTVTTPNRHTLIIILILTLELCN